jgi:hypothetical protein
MGNKGFVTSVAGAVVLTVASLMLFVGVSSVIAFRGWPSVRDGAGDAGTVTLAAAPAPTGTPGASGQRVVLGAGARRVVRRRPSVHRRTSSGKGLHARTSPQRTGAVAPRRRSATRTVRFRAAPRKPASTPTAATPNTAATREPTVLDQAAGTVDTVVSRTTGQDPSAPGLVQTALDGLLTPRP